jgi:hypothetical protein
MLVGSPLLDASGRRRRYVLNDGEKYFMMKSIGSHTDLAVSELRAENITCAIQEVGSGNS